MTNAWFFSALTFLLPALATCQTGNPAIKPVPTPSPEFEKYWYQGKAELTSFDLQQARYGEYHKGTAMLIFVTEDISKSKQVKLDNPMRNPTDAVKVLKMNLTKKFATGLYEYSTMESAFTPIDRIKNPYTIKVSMSAQDWCGHVFCQLNLQTYKYRFQQFSYFEKDAADVELILEKALLEEELFNLIRINPQHLPLGVFDMIPNTLTSRLRHTPVNVESAEATLAAHATLPNCSTYTLWYRDSKRKLAIHFQTSFPYTIEGWEESYNDNGVDLTTRATRKKTILSDYWTKHNTTDAALRKELGLE